MRSVFMKLLSAISHVQVLLVFLAFAIMVFLSYYFMSDIERRHLLRDVDYVISNTQNNIETDLLEPQATLGVIAETVRTMIIHGEDFSEVSDYLTDTTKYINGDGRLMSYATVVYGFFDVYGGRVWYDREMELPNDYITQERPWYVTALEANGKVGVTEPYMNKLLNDTCITFARRIFDGEGRPLGIICLDVLLDRIMEYAVNTHVTESSYGILIDRQFNVIAHPDPAYIGIPISHMNDGYAIQEALLQGREISERKAVDYNGNSSVIFMRQLKNGWYMAIVAYSKEYYQSVTNIGIVLSVFGVILAVMLSALLLSIVSARKKAEERTRVMLDATPLCVNFWDKKFNVIDCNQEAVNFFSMSSKKDYIENFYKLSPDYQPDGRLSFDKSKENIKKAFEEGWHRFEWIHRKMSGEHIPCEITLVRVKYRNGYIVCGYMRDLREMKAMIAKVREAVECTKVLFDATPLSCFMFDKSYNVIECNMEAVKLFGFSDKDDYIKKFYDFFPEYQPDGRLSRKQANRYIDEALEEGYCHFEWIHKDIHGEFIPCDVTLVRVKNKGEYAVACYVRSLREYKAMIAEAHRAEIAEESSKAKSDFLARMSHEIRTPMNAILGITEIQLQDETLPLGAKDALERIYSSGDLLLGIINDILDLSKIEAGKLELVQVQYDIASLIHDTVQLNILRYESKSIEFSLAVNEDVPSTLIGDELRIKQILNNLISNAFKYTKEGMIKITISVEPCDENSSVTLVFTVSDTGQGMTEAQVRELGGRYTRFNLENNRKTEGTGLGMNITMNLVNMMNGDISIKSAPDVGSTFTVSLPQKCLDPAPLGRELAENLMRFNVRSTSKNRNATITHEYMPYGRVLVVDDVETNLYVARGLMTPYGLTIDTALSGYEAIEKVKGGNVYDIIFMDHMMPGMDGIETVKIIRDLDYKYPVIALTANALSGQAEIFFNNGFDDFISKPIDIRQLNASLNKLIRDKQPPEVIENARKQKAGNVDTDGHISSQLSEFFIRDAEKADKILSAISRNYCRRGDDISTVIIQAHSMKSALANIGEFDLSASAQKIEQAGREQDVKVILSELQPFLEKLRGVMEKLEQDDDRQDEEAADLDIDSQLLQEKLLAIQAACEEYDKKTAKDALTELRQKNWPNSIKKHFNAIAECLLHSEFEEAASVAKEIQIS